MKNVARYLFPALVAILVLVPVVRNHAADAPQAPTPPGPSGEPAPAAAAAAPVSGAFPRVADPIVVKGQDAPKLLGAVEGELRVFAEKNGTPQVIPYQMDERNQWGEFVIVHGKRVVPDEDKGKYDEDDELVFLGRDLGGKLPKAQWPEGAKASYEVEVADPLTGAKGYAYLAVYGSASSAPPPSPVSYMKYEDKGDGLATGLNYELGFLKSTSGLDYNHLVVKKAAGGDDVNHFDRLKVRVVLKLRRGYTLGIPKTFNKNEKNFLVKYYGYKDGPVRSLRVMKNNLQLIWKLPSPGATVNSVFYPDWIEWPVPINLPVRPGWLFSRQELDVSHDFNFPPDKGVKLFVSSHPDKWYEVTSKTSPEMMALNKETTEGGYYGIDATSIGAGGWFYTVRRPKSFDTKLGGVFRSDTSESGEPEYYGDQNNEPERGWIKGSTPLAGGRFVDWNDVGRGIHTVFFYHIYPPNYKPGAEKAYMNILDHPVEVSLSE